jgi:hypothetical protein
LSFWCQNFFQKTNKSISRFLPFAASWGLPGDLVNNIINKEAYRKPRKAFRKPPGRYKKFQGRNPETISLFFWKKF